MSLRPFIYFFLDFFNVGGAHSSQADGRPISHLLKAGFNWPPLSIPAEQPISISPEAVSRAGPVVVGQPAICAPMFNFLCMCCSGVPPGWFAVGVAHPARHTDAAKSGP
jgi:hypothetical protein